MWNAMIVRKDKTDSKFSFGVKSSWQNLFGNVQLIPLWKTFICALSRSDYLPVEIRTLTVNSRQKEMGQPQFIHTLLSHNSSNPNSGADRIKLPSTFFQVLHVYLQTCAILRVVKMKWILLVTKDDSLRIKHCFVSFWDLCGF